MKFLLLTFVFLTLNLVCIRSQSTVSEDDAFGRCLQECGCDKFYSYYEKTSFGRRLLQPKSNNVKADIVETCNSVEQRSCIYGCGCNAAGLDSNTNLERRLNVAYYDPTIDRPSASFYPEKLAEQFISCGDWCDASQHQTSFDVSTSSTQAVLHVFYAIYSYRSIYMGSTANKLAKQFPGPSYTFGETPSSLVSSLYQWVNEKSWDFDYDGCITGCEAMDYCHGDGCSQCSSIGTKSCIAAELNFTQVEPPPPDSKDLRPQRRLAWFESVSSSLIDSVCECNMGYTGIFCDDNAEGYCNGVMCNNTGTCTDSFCVCNDGYEGISCDQDIDDCVNDPCGMHGTCTDAGTNMFSCACSLGYNGTLCDEDADDCAGGPCGSYGVCTDLGTSNFTCECNMEYTGIYCDKHADGYCAGNICDMGLCENSTCECMDGYEGSSCTIYSDDCADDPCGMHGTCIDAGTNMFTCVCDTGYNGTLCDEDVEDCASEPCGMYGTCSDVGANNFTCACDSGYAGALCDENADGYCAGSICVEGTCTDDGCVCTSGWDGASCDEDFDDCAANPCIEDLGFSDFLSSSGASAYEDIVLDDYFICQDFGTNNYTCTLTITLAATTMAPSIVSALLAAVVAFMAYY